MSDWSPSESPFTILKDLRRERAQLFERTSALSLQCAQQCRDFTASERCEYDANMSTIDSLGKKIAEAEKLVHAG